jgi:hypothetical protein
MNNISLNNIFITHNWQTVMDYTNASRGYKQYITLKAGDEENDMVWDVL